MIVYAFLFVLDDGLMEIGSGRVERANFCEASYRYGSLRLEIYRSD